MTATTRGPLPAGVYWRRRLFVLGLLAAVVFVLVSLVRGGGHDGGDAGGKAALSADTGRTTRTTPSDAGTPRGSQPAPGGRRTPDAQPTAPVPDPPPAEPQGTCQDRDVSVTPSIEDSVAGEPVSIRLDLRTLKSPACTWRVSSKHMAVRITDGSTLIWTSQQCRFGIPQSDVVVRRAEPTTVTMTWRARESRPGCPRNTDWVLPGDFTVTAAALGGEPATDTFNLTRPESSTVVLPPRTTPDLQGDKGGQDGKNGKRPKGKKNR